MSLLYAQISEKNRPQEPNTISFKSATNTIDTPVNNVYKQYSADGRLESNKFWKQSPTTWPTVPQPNDARNGGPIYITNPHGEILNGYQPSIIRPIDSVRVPRDLKRGTFDEEKCNWPCYAGSKWQEWCSEEDAIKYHAMRPLVTPDTYNKWLKKLFYTTAEGHNKEPMIDNNVWGAVFCQNSKTALMNFIMKKVADGVALIPEMQKNGSWGFEQFHWTDAKIYQYANETELYYKILFNLYNPLRSVGTEVQTVIKVSPQNVADLKITYMDFVNQLEWKMDGQKIDGIAGYNLAPAGQNPQINLETEVEGPVPTSVGWNYGNTLLNQQFNKYGFYENGRNVEINAGVPDSLKKRLNNFEQGSNSYLFGCATSRFSGSKVVDDFEKRKIEQSGTPQSLMQNPSIVFGVPLELEYKKNGNLVEAVKRYPKTEAIGTVFH